MLLYSRGPGPGPGWRKGCGCWELQGSLVLLQWPTGQHCWWDQLEWLSGLFLLHSCRAALKHLSLWLLEGLSVQDLCPSDC